MSKEPALILGAIALLLNLAVGFGLNITAEQVGLINAAVAGVMAVIIRSQVNPVVK